MLRLALETAEHEAKQVRESVRIKVADAKPGLYIEFESAPFVELKLESLENRKKGIELVAVRTLRDREDNMVQRATVFVPDGALKHFVGRFDEYANELTPKKKEPKHKDVYDRIARLRRATLRALWTETHVEFPDPAKDIWWEVWLRKQDGRELDRLLDFAAQTDLIIGPHRLAFDDRIVVLVRGSANVLSTSLDVLNDLAEIRLAKESAAFFESEPAEEQAEWVNDLRRRVVSPRSDAPAVCVLDTGVTRGHPLLEDLILPEDVHAVEPAWGGHDDGGGQGNAGHGTEMAGLAAYGDLTIPLGSSAPLLLVHRLESVKILPPHGANHPDLYGAITAQAVSLPEIAEPLRLRAFSMAVTAKDQRDRGEPTSWSSAIDALAAGRSFEPATSGLVYLDAADSQARRLFILSAGNVDQLEIAYLDRCDLEAVHDPGQAWNALTVGGMTDKARIQDPSFDGWSPLGRPGDLSPWSTTSLCFDSMWPIKPDVVFECGNAAHDGSRPATEVPDLCLLTTSSKPAERSLTSVWATSAASAQVARMAAIIQATYPDYWPETVRALIVHSAEWTDAMKTHVGGSCSKGHLERLARRYGYGVPSLERALRSAGDAVTLIVQSSIRPFCDGKMKDMHLHDLPWPTAILEDLGQTEVRLRVTLSYFVEPNPGRRGWKRRHRYASHGLRFAIKFPTETREDFRKRVKNPPPEGVALGAPRRGRHALPPEEAR